MRSEEWHESRREPDAEALKETHSLDSDPVEKLRQEVEAWFRDGAELLRRLYDTDPDAAWREFGLDWAQDLDRVIAKDFKILREPICSECGGPVGECICLDEEDDAITAYKKMLKREIKEQFTL